MKEQQGLPFAAMDAGHGDSQALLCPNGHRVPVGSRFCPECGAAIETTVTHESTSPSARTKRTVVPWLVGGGVLLAVAVATLVVLASGRGVAVQGTYCCICITELTFTDGSGDTLGVAELANEEVQTSSDHPGSCGMSADFTVELPKADLYQAVADAPGDAAFIDGRTKTYGEISAPDFVWTVVVI